jgi:hypothetical protein
MNEMTSSYNLQTFVTYIYVNSHTWLSFYIFFYHVAFRLTFCSVIAVSVGRISL